MSEHQEKAREREALTNWRAQWEGQVRTTRKRMRVGVTCSLTSTQVWTTPRESEKVRDTHQLSRDKSDHHRKGESEGDPLPVEGRGRDESGQREGARERGILTYCRVQKRDMLGHQENAIKGDTHSLSSTDDKSGNQEKARERGALTICRGQRDKSEP
jgi:hypothetical protein